MKATMADFRGTPTSIGSLPHTDVDEAVRTILDLCPELPAAPQLPRRAASEGMLAQVAIGIDGVAIDDGGALVVARPRAVAAGDPSTPIDVAAWATTLAFLDAVAGRITPIKVQVVGPVTLGLALLHAGVAPPLAFRTAAASVDRHVRALATIAGSSAPDAPLVMVLDEPGLVGLMGADFPLEMADTIDLLSGGLAAASAARPGVIAGIHCCGPTDWSVVIDAGPDLLSLPIDASATLDGAGLGVFFERGGHVAWGAVPTDRPLGERDDVHWRALSEVWCDLSRAGTDPLMLRDRSLITPACGLANHTPAQVTRIFGLVRHMAERVEDQATAARLSAGA